MNPAVHTFGGAPISCHAWSGDLQQLALSPNNHEVHVYRRSGKEWEKVDTLVEHFQRVTGIDWAPRRDCLVTCGADRNAYVWTQQEGKWKPTLVILRLHRAATCVRWSPDEQKFAVGSAARAISICYFEKENDWWVSKHIKKPLRSTVTSLDWHPGSVLLAAGATDFKARVFSAYIKEIEPKPEGTVWGKKMPFAALLAEHSAGGAWVHAVAFSPCGNKLAWTAHDATLSVVEGGEGVTPVVLRTDLLPLTCVVWLGTGALLAAGHDCTPVAFSLHASGQLALQTKLDQKPAEDQGEKPVSAMDRFRSMDKRGVQQDDNEISTTHQNTISGMAVVERAAGGVVTKVATSGIDGRLCVWDLQSLERKLSDLKIC